LVAIFPSMPTPSEQKALAFVAIVILLGGAARVLRAGATPTPAVTPLEQQALARQAAAASSSAAAPNGKRAGKGARSLKLTLKKRDAGAKEVAGVVSVPPATDPLGFPPAGPRIDSDLRGRTEGAPATSLAGREPYQKGLPAATIDLDQATEAEIDRLPRVGPALARRIVANRDSLGPFGALSGLRRVRGIGPATLERLAPLVTFSGQVRR
jgi:competence protein ComEA